MLSHWEGWKGGGSAHAGREGGECTLEGKGGVPTGGEGRGEEGVRETRTELYKVSLLQVIDSSTLEIEKFETQIWKSRILNLQNIWAISSQQNRIKLELL